MVGDGRTLQGWKGRQRLGRAEVCLAQVILAEMARADSLLRQSPPLFVIRFSTVVLDQMFQF